MEAVNMHQVKQRVDRSLKAVSRILDNERHPLLAEEVQHEYQDKYLLGMIGGK